MVGIVSTRRGPALIKRIGWEGLNSFVLQLFFALVIIQICWGQAQNSIRTIEEQGRILWHKPGFQLT